MDRRSFTKGLLLSGAAMTTVLDARSAFASEQESEEIKKQFSRVILTILATQVIISTFLVLTNRGFMGVDLRGQTEFQPAEKLDVSTVPLIGGLFAPTLFNQFKGASLVGTIYLLGSTLILLPAVASLALLSVFWLTHRDRVYKPRRRLKKVQLKTELTEEQIKAGKVVGRAVMADDILLGMIGPSIFDAIEFKAK